MTPNLLTGINTGIGGDPTANPYSGGANPAATLEVNAWGGALTTLLPGGNSGLRFTNLTSATPPNPLPNGNPPTGVLSVNATGDVIYVPANNTPAIGNYCPDPDNAIIDDFEVPLNGLSYSFTAAPNSNDNSRVNIGNLACGTTFPARLYVRETDPMPSATFHTAITGVTEGGALPALAPSFGVIGLVSSAKSYTHAGVYGASTSAANDILTSQTLGIGVYGTASQNDQNFGVVGVVNDASGRTNVGVYGWAENGTDENIGILGQATISASSPTNRAGYFLGDLEYTGAIIGAPSDQNLKKNIQTLENADSILQLLFPKTFEYKIQDYPQLNLNSGVKMGFIAQEVEQVLPQFVKQSHRKEVRDSLGNQIHPEIIYKSLINEEFIPLLVAGYKAQGLIIKQQDSIINTLKVNDSILNSRLTAIETCVNNSNLCNKKVKKSLMEENEETNTNTHTTEITLTDLQYIILDQNVPNPFAEQTSIGYFLPEDIKKAQVVFHNADGKMINSLMISERGRGSLNVYADDLSSGVYSYTLIADGKVIDTKRMVKN
jgi:hypothetical protein